MEYVCDGVGRTTWFRLVTEGEAIAESDLMGHAVAKHFCRAQDEAARSYNPAGLPFIEQDIARAAHIRRAMPVFLTLRDEEGAPHVTAMLPPAAGDRGFRCIVVGRANADPYPEHGAAIDALARHTGLPLDRATCFPYRRG
jgi:hypothetical protein